MGNRYFWAYGFWHAGEGFQTILMMWYMAFHTRLSAAEIGFYQALQLSPFLAFTLFGGSLTDRIGARASYASSTGLFALTLAFYGLAEPAFGFHPWLFAAYCLLSGLFSAISNPAIDTLIPEATPRPASDNALIAATVHNMAKLSGNAATLLLPLLSAVGGFLANGFLMGMSVLLLRSHTPREATPDPVPAAAWPSPRRMARHFRAYPESLDIFLGSIMLGLFVVPSGYIFQPLIMRQHFPDQSSLFGLTGIVSWCGAILASSLAVRFAARTRHPGRWAMLVWAIAALVLVGSVLVPDFWLYLVILFLLGGNSVGKALIYGRYLGDAPRGERGVLIALDQTAFWGLATLGTAILGWFAGRVGLLPAVLTLAGAILLSVLVLLLRGRLWRLARVR